MDYQAVFGINCGASSGLTLRPDYVKRSEPLTAETDREAYQDSMAMARTFAVNYLSNPNTGLTRVELLSLKSPEGDVDVPLETESRVVQA